MTDVTRARLVWLCRRGMRELDLVLTGWLESHYAEATDEERAVFCELLERPDPQIFDYLTDREQPETEPLRLLINVLKRRNHNTDR